MNTDTFRSIAAAIAANEYAHDPRHTCASHPRMRCRRCRDQAALTDSIADAIRHATRDALAEELAIATDLRAQLDERTAALHRAEAGVATLVADRQRLIQDHGQFVADMEEGLDRALRLKSQWLAAIPTPEELAAITTLADRARRMVAYSGGGDVAEEARAARDLSVAIAPAETVVQRLQTSAEAMRQKDPHAS